MSALALMTSAPHAPPRPLLVSKAQAAHELDMGVRQIDVLEARGQIRLVRIGRMVKVPTSEIERIAREGAPLPEGK